MSTISEGGRGTEWNNIQAESGRLEPTISCGLQDQLSQKDTDQTFREQIPRRVQDKLASAPDGEAEEARLFP